MKKIISAVLALLIFLCGCVDISQNDAEKSGKFKIVASFYPMYITALNVADGIEGVEVENLVGSTVGCLHDYTLTTGNMKTLEECDVLIVNGAGMEPFMEKVISLRPELDIIDAAGAVDKIVTDGEVNPHVWLDVNNAILQLETVTDELCRLAPAYQEDFRKNAEIYKDKLIGLDEKLRNGLSGIKNGKLVTFHEAFEYFAKAYGLEVVACLYRDEHSAPSPREVGNVIEIMKKDGITALFTEPEYHDSLADTVVNATGAEIYVLDPCVSGSEERDSYIATMEKNMDALIAAFGI